MAGGFIDIGGHFGFRSFRKASILALRTAFFLLLWFLFQNNSFAQVTADFSASITEGCSPLVVCFTDLSTGNPNTWMWNFGNGNLSPDHNPCAIYITPGTYTVSLTASNGSSTDTKTVNALIRVFANPTVNFSASKTLACAGEDISFTDQTSLGDAPLVSWRWDFGDGNTSTQSNPTNTYTNPGTYTVVLEVTDANGCEHRKSITDMITILASPSADFSAAPNFACSYPATISFSDQSSGSMISTYLWNFGDGATSSQQNPVHTYATPGSYKVTLKVTNSAGCSNTKTVNGFIVIDDLQADFSVNKTSGCGEVSVNFSDQSSTVSVITDWNWDFGDGGTSNVENTTHTYTTPGTYDVTLVVTNNRSCKDTIVYDDLITVYAEPAVDFTADKTKGCSLPLVVNFSETATHDASWLWNFGDGATSTEQNPTHSYA
ncbi:MAG TPA: PKD domain-containing protein, partial [Chitinophagales bacterium]|nr:PKD domain-containing protein [Chitinophagales bacterium]